MHCDKTKNGGTAGCFILIYLFEHLLGPEFEKASNSTAAACSWNVEVLIA